MAAVDQHSKLDRGRAAIVEELVDRSAHAAAGVEHIVDEDDRRAFDLERNLARSYSWLESGAVEIVAIVRNVDVPDRMIAGDRFGEPLREPRAAGINAHEPRVVCDRAAHLLHELGERLLGVRQGHEVRRFFRRARIEGSAAPQPHRALPRVLRHARRLRAGPGRRSPS